MSCSSQMFISGFLTLLLFTLNVFVSISVPLPDGNELSHKLPDIMCKKREFYHNETRQCYRERTKGPCNGNMIFIKLESIFGDCDCTEDGVVPWIYHPETNDCYESYKQAHCSSGEWLTFDILRNPICSLNPCNGKQFEDEEHPTVLFKSKCVSLNKPSELCNPSEEIRIKNDDVIPECISNLQEFSVTSTNQLKCRPGTKRDRNGTCRKTVTIFSSTDY